jgi:hypothetical protein
MWIKLYVFAIPFTMPWREVWQMVLPRLCDLTRA